MTATVAFRFLSDVSVYQWPPSMEISSVGEYLILLLTFGYGFEYQIEAKNLQFQDF